MEFASRGAAALDSGDALSAVSAYTQALNQHPSSPDYFIQRSIAFTRLKAPHEPQHDLSLIDAEYAVLLGQKRARREKIQAAQQRRVVALFGLKQYANAAFILSTMERWRTKEKRDKMEGDMWKAKVEQKLNALPADDPARQVTVKEYPDKELPSDAAMKKMLQAQLKADGTFNFETESEEAREGTKTEVVASGPTKSSQDAPSNGIMVDHEMVISSAPAMSHSESSTAATPQPMSKIRHEWFQNAQNVTITLYAKGVPKDSAEIEFNEDSVSVSFPHPSNPASTFTFTLDPLFALIDDSASKASIMSTKVELTLRKKMVGEKWSALEGLTPLKEVANQAKPSSAKSAILSTLGDSTSKKSTETAPSYPTSSRTGPKNWDKLADDLTAKKKSSHKHKGEKSADKKEGAEGEQQQQEDDDIDSDYGGDPVDGFFKKLYAGADDDTRRAMMKSYQESGGTALSTDWKDVAKKKYDPVEDKKHEE